MNAKLWIRIALCGSLGCLLATSARGNEKPKEKSEHGEAKEAKAEKKEGQGGKKEGGEGHGGKPIDTTQRTNSYVNAWTKFPELKVLDLRDKSPSIVAAEKDQVFAVVFLASWCLPCQKYAKVLQNIALKYTPSKVRTVFVFTYDTQADAQAFAAQYGFAAEDVFLATPATLIDFNQPELPSIFASDRHAWLSFMDSQSDDKLFQEFDQYLKFNSVL